MQEKQSPVADHLAASVEELHFRFGAWRTAWALVRAIRKRRRTRNQLSHLSDGMLRDMGLPERPESHFKGQTVLWDIWK